jgi:hypothetical protein
MGRHGAWLVIVGVAACHHASPRPSVTCLSVGDRVLALSGADLHAYAVRRAFVDRCESDGWRRDARTCFAGLTRLEDTNECREHLDPEVAHALGRALDAVETRVQRLLPQSCSRYRRSIFKLAATCNALLPSQRDQLQVTYEHVAKAWDRGSMADLAELDRQCSANAAIVEPIVRAACEAQ